MNYTKEHIHKLGNNMTVTIVFLPPYVKMRTKHKSKVMRCSRHGNLDRMYLRLNGDPLEEVDCFKYLFRNWQLMEVVKGMWYTE